MQPFWDMAIAPLKASAVELALSVGLFDHTAPASAAMVADRHGLHPANCGPWLDLLWSLELLDRDGGADPLYCPSALARDCFTSGGAQDCSTGWRFRVGAMAGFAEDLADLVRGGPQTPPRIQSTPPASWSDAARVQIAQEQAAISVPSFLQWLASVSASARLLPPQGRFLDLGGGPGLIAMGFASHMPGWTVTVFDLPQTVAVAQDNIAAAGLESRATTLGGNLDQDDFGSGYDLIWCSSVLHFVRDPDDVLARVLAALNPGGLFVAAHAERPDAATDAARVLPFYLPMMLRGRHVAGGDALPDAMARAGFAEVVTDGWLPFPLAPVRVHRGRRPC